MSENIKKCKCGAIFKGKTPSHWFECSLCGTIYIQRDGLWYEEDEIDEDE